MSRRRSTDPSDTSPTARLGRLSDVELDAIAAAIADAQQREQSGESVEAARAWLRAAEFALHTSDSPRAVDAFSRAAGLQPDGRAAAAAAERAATAASHSGDARARELWIASAERWEAVGEQALATRSRFHAAWAGGDDALAAQLTELGRGVGGWALHARAREAAFADDFDGSLDLDIRALDAAREQGDRLLEALALFGIGHAASILGAIDDAVTATRQAIAIGRGRHGQRWVFMAWNTLVELLNDAGRPEEALHACDDLLDDLRRHHLDGWTCAAVAHRALCLSRLGRLDEAMEHARDAWTDTQEREPDVLHAMVPVIAASVALDAGHARAPWMSQLIDRAVDAAAHTGFESLQFEARLVRLRSQISSQPSGAGDYLRSAGSLAISEPEAVGRAAVFLARRGAIYDDRTLINAARTLADGLPSEIPPVAQLACAEVAAIVGRRVADLRSCERRWRDAGYALDAAQTSLVAGFWASRNELERADAIRQLVEAHHELSLIGARELAALAVRGLERIVTEDRVAELLRDPSPFADLPGAVRAEIEQANQRLRVARGHVFYEPDDPAESVFLLTEGQVRLYRIAPTGRQLIVAMLEPGAVFGEAGLAGLTTEGMYAVADVESTVLRIPSGAFRELVRKYPSSGVRLVASLSMRLVRAHEQAEEVAYWPLEQRLARVLLEFADRFGHPTIDGGTLIDQSYTQQEIADLVGCTRQSLAAALGDLRAQGTIEMRGRRMILRDRSSLESLLNAA